MRQVTLLSLLALPSTLLADDLRYDFIQEKHNLASDNREILTYTEQTSILSQSGAISAQKYPITYYPDTESLKILQASVTKKDGKIITVDKNQIFERNADDNPSAPGFNNRITTTVVFPSLSVGDQINISYAINHFIPQNNHENFFQGSYNNELKTMEIIYQVSPEHYLQWAEHGGFHVEDKKNRDGIRVIKAVLENQMPKSEEVSTANLGDNIPYFIVSTKSSWQEVGDNFYQSFEPKVVVDKKIRTLSNKITKGKKGYEGAELLANWVAQNIHYIAVSRQQTDGYIPHTVSEILNNGYGDCKDKALLLVTLLKSIGVDSQPVLIDADLNYYAAPIPYNSQFNHVIVYIPEFNLYTDPTNPYAEFSNLPYNDQGKFVVRVAKKSTTALTPFTNVKDKYYSAHKKFYIDDKGNVNGTIEIHTKNRFSRVLRQLIQSNHTDTFVHNVLADSEGGNGEFTSSAINDLTAPMSLTAKWCSPQAINIEPTSYFQLPTGFDTWQTRFVQEFIQYTDRTTPIFVGSGTMVWNNEYHLPKGFQVTHLPSNVHINNLAGSLDVDYSKEEGVIKYRERFVVNKDVFTPKEYPELRALLQQVIKVQKNIVAIRKG